MHNAEATLEVCLSSIFASKDLEEPFEVIVVDDGSTDRSVQIARQFDCKVINLGRNMGVSAARNAGAKATDAQIIYFVDADIVQKPDTIAKLLEAFREDPESAVAQAVWAKEPLNPSFGAYFWALKTYYLVKIKQLGDVDVRKDARSFNSGCLAIKREVFWEFGGFDERFKQPGGEEHLLAFRMAGKYPLFQYKEIEVYHHFAGAWPKVRIQFRRAMRLGRVFRAKRQFGEVGAITQGEALRCLLALSIIIFLVLGVASRWFLVATVASGLAFLITGAGFYAFLARERGLGFAVVGIVYDMLLYVVAGIGLGLGMMRSLAGVEPDRVKS